MFYFIIEKNLVQNEKPITFEKKKIEQGKMKINNENNQHMKKEQWYYFEILVGLHFQNKDL